MRGQAHAGARTHARTLVACAPAGTVDGCATHVRTHACCTQAWCVAGNFFSLQKEHEAAVELFQRALQVCGGEEGKELKGIYVRARPWKPVLAPVICLR